MEDYEKLLPEEELIKLLSDFYGKDYIEASDLAKKELHDGYRKAERENIEQIRQAGGVENWYLSGQGRLLNLTDNGRTKD